MTYWQAYTNSDLTEGRGHDVHIAYFVRREDAVRCVVGKGPMGTNAYVREVRRHVVFKSYAEYETRQVGEARKRALEKLSAEERRLLGLE